MDKFSRKEFLKSKLLNGGCSQEELEELYFLFDQYGSPEEMEILMEMEWEAKNNFKLKEKDADYIYAQIKKSIPRTHRTLNFKLSHLQVSRIAAAIILLAVFGWAFRGYLQEKDIVPEVKMITRHAEKGQKLKFTLPDGSMVNLNSTSSITYPEIFSDSTRSIKLEGEAFFNVTKNPEKPFVVESNGLFTTVLGTSFNIRAFRDNPVEVTVATGIVRVSPAITDSQSGLDSKVVQGELLKPNQQARFNPHDLSIAVTDVELGPYLAWKSNTLYFEMVPFARVITILERWYNIELDLKNDLSNQCLVRANYKNENLINVLDGLKLLVNFDYEFTGKNQIIITGKGCKTNK
ncbi:FecR family protein [Flexithrix dorotheae]|uniref:FecR family protein n=1 Tax=Flexithrix dorotheae TaxID=70993 RepID=UPI0003676D42|nr:FecR family protein [Flexithrix dorotheae]